MSRPTLQRAWAAPLVVFRAEVWLFPDGGERAFRGWLPPMPFQAVIGVALARSADFDPPGGDGYSQVRTSSKHPRTVATICFFSFRATKKTNRMPRLSMIAHLARAWSRLTLPSS